MTLSLIDALVSLGIQLNRWIAPIVLVLGILGNTFNLLIFSREIFIKHSCSLYLITISINNLVMLSIGLVTRILDEGFQATLFGGTSVIYCKGRNTLVFFTFALSSWLFIIAAVDRYYSTNQSASKRRQICSTRMALKFICLTIIACLLMHIHMLIYWNNFYKMDVYGQFSWTCTADDIVYNLFFAFFMSMFYSLLPPTLMGIVGFLTLKNIRGARRHVNPSSTNHPTVRRDKNQLMKSLSIQIIILIILTSPHSCYWLYTAFSTAKNSDKTNIVRASEKFALNVVRLLLYVNYSSSFYIQLFVSKTFREECIKILTNAKRRLRALSCQRCVS